MFLLSQWFCTVKKKIPLLGYQERAGVNFSIQSMIPGIQLIFNYTGSGIISYLMTPKFLIESKELDKLDIYSCRTILHGYTTIIDCLVIFKMLE